MPLATINYAATRARRTREHDAASEAARRRAGEPFLDINTNEESLTRFHRTMLASPPAMLGRIYACRRLRNTVIIDALAALARQESTTAHLRERHIRMIRAARQADCLRAAARVHAHGRHGELEIGSPWRARFSSVITLLLRRGRTRKLSPLQ